MVTDFLARIRLPLGAALLLAFANIAHAATLAPALTDALSNSAAGEPLEIIVTFHGNEPPESHELALLRELGLGGIHFRALPIAGVLATPAQVEQLAASPLVRSLWLNERLAYENDTSTAMTGVDRARTDRALRTALGMPFTGKGIGVLVNDSGIDGTHEDLKYPNHVVQNVAGQTNLNSWSELLPVTYTENVPNTDIEGGHGTHVAGIVGASGARSGGLYEGVAPGASIIGYGSGAALFILDSLGGFDYALVNQSRYNIRVVTNSFGNTGDTGTDFNPDDPTNVATKMLADRNVVVVFSAGNSGSGESTMTGNFKKAPWVVAVAAGDKTGNLSGYSSRGVGGKGGSVTIDGETFTWEDRPTITAPGTNVISTRASTADPTYLLSIDTEVEELGPAHAPFYTTLSGTSMAAPHAAGLVALMLEANPQLHWSDVKQILQDTATNIPGMEAWESGAGYANVHAALARVLELRSEYGSTVNSQRSFNSHAIVEVASEVAVPLYFTPVGEPEEYRFEVAGDISRVSASAVVDENTVALVLIDPDGNRYGSSIALPLLGPSIGVSAPGKAGEWTLTVRGIGSVSGVALDPLGITNGTALPGTINSTLKQWRSGEYIGLDDIAGHPAEGMIQFAVRERLADGFSDGQFHPDLALKRVDLAEYLTMGNAVRQFLPLDGSRSFGDVRNDDLGFVEAVIARGAALKDPFQQFDGVVRTDGGMFKPNAKVSRAELAYSLVQSLGLQEQARSVGADAQLHVRYNGQEIPLDDSDAVPGELKGYVQIALDLNLMRAQFYLEQGPFDLQPTLHASFNPEDATTRAEYAAVANRFLDLYEQSRPR